MEMVVVFLKISIVSSVAFTESHPVLWFDHNSEVVCRIPIATQSTAQ